MRPKFLALTVFFSFFLVSVTAGTAKADSFNISWAGVYGTGTGTITGEDLGGGIFQLTSMDGSQDGVTATLLPQSAYGVNGNFIYPTSTPQLDDLGFAFLAGTTEYNIYFDDVVSGVYRECSSVSTDCTNFGDGIAIDSFSITPPSAPVPEPGSLILLGTGLLGLAGAVRRKLLA
jgi:PEP-CTERM motif-containing protein